MGSWLNRISPMNAGMLLQHVRSLTCYTADRDIPNSSLGPVDFLRDHSSSLCRLERLTLDPVWPLSPVLTETFTGFQHTLSYLRLRSLGLTANTIVTLINYLPHLAHLHLSACSHEEDDQTTFPFSRPLKELTVQGFYPGCLALLDPLMRLHPQCDKITAELMLGGIVPIARSVSHQRCGGQHKTPEPKVRARMCVQRFKNSSVSMAECSCNSVTGLGNPLTLSNCGELRELEIYASHPRSLELALISSITSTKIQRITFTKRSNQCGRKVLPETWAQLDNSLCQLVERLEPGIRLEVKFRAFNAKAWWREERGFEKCLPKSYEKGVIKPPLGVCIRRSTPEEGGNK